MPAANKGSKTSGQLVHSDKKVLYLALYFLVNGVGLIARQFLASTVMPHSGTNSVQRIENYDVIK